MKVISRHNNGQPLHTISERLITNIYHTYRADGTIFLITCVNTSSEWIVSGVNANFSSFKYDCYFNFYLV